MNSAPSAAQSIESQPIEAPSIPLDELKEVTNNFGNNTLIGEGSYGKVFYGVLKNRRAVAIKKLDSNKQPDQEFLAQVWWQIRINLKSHVQSETMFLYNIFTGISGIKAET